MSLSRSGPPERRTRLTAHRGLSRHTELPRGDGPQRHAPLPRPVHPPEAPKPRQRRTGGQGGAVRSSQRQATYRRDEDRCVRCGRELRPGLRQLQHRVPRGAGGRADHDRLSALVLLCGTSATDPRGCHHWAETRRLDAQAVGLLVPMGMDPLTWDVLYPDGHRYRLDDEGGRTLVA